MRTLWNSATPASIFSALLVALAVILLGTPPLMLSQESTQGPSRDETLRYINDQLSKYGIPGHEAKCGHPDHELKVEDNGRTLAVTQLARTDGCATKTFQVPLAMLDSQNAFADIMGDYYLVQVRCVGNQGPRSEPTKSCYSIGSNEQPALFLPYYGPEEGAERLTRALSHLVQTSQDILKQNLDAHDPFAK